MELCLGKGQEPLESLWVMISRHANMVATVVDIFYRSSYSEEADEAFFKQVEDVSWSQTLVLMGDFNQSNICWKDNAV